MIGFKEFFLENFLIERAMTAASKEAAAEGSSKNFSRGHAYETATAIWLHENTAAKHNMDPGQRERFQRMMDEHKQHIGKMSQQEQMEIYANAEKSGKAYLESLKREEGINPEDVHEIYHTYAGIDPFFNKKVSKTGNPHDIVVRTHDGRAHGASLKFKSGTLSNNTANSYDEMMRRNGFNSNIGGVWDAKKREIGLSGLSNKEIKAIRDKPSVVRANAEAQHMAGEHHAETFNSGKLAQQKALLNEIMKANPDMPYHYVVGDKGTSEDILKKKQYQLFRNAKSLNAVHTGNGVVHIVDHEGNHIVSVEHRPTHGSFLSIQANTKLGTGKRSNALPPLPQPQQQQVKK